MRSRRLDWRRENLGATIVTMTPLQWISGITHSTANLPVHVPYTTFAEPLPLLILQPSLPGGQSCFCSGNGNAQVGETVTRLCRRQTISLKSNSVISHCKCVYYLPLPFFPFVRGGVLSATSSLPHLIVFSTLLCLLSSSSSLPPLLPSSPLSYHSPPISALASLVSSCPPHVTLPLSSVVCQPPSFLCVLPTVVCSSPVSLSSSSALPSLLPSALVTLADFRTLLHTCALCCCSSGIVKVSVPHRHAGVTQVLMPLPFSFFYPQVGRHPSTALPFSLG